MSKFTLNPALLEKSKRAARKTWVSYLLVLIAWVTVVLALTVVSFLLCSSIIWYDSFLYRLLNWVRDYIVFVDTFVVLMGWVVISYFYIARPVQEMELLLSAAGDLAHPTEDPISLPESLKSAEDQLNLVREQALRDTRAAREAEQRKNDLVVYLAHDLKTPLTSVIGYLTLLRDEPQISPELRGRYTGIALEKAERLEDLVNEFFDITRFSLTTLELEVQSVDLTRLLQQLSSEFAPVLHEKGMDCTLSLPPALHVLCDPDKIARVFDNLLNNACHYAYPDSTLSIEGFENGEEVVLRFRNAGHTIPPEKLQRMFERFFRLDSSRSTKSGNAGLGLAIAKEIVEAHGGAISAQSENEQIIFTVKLPASPPAVRKS